MNAEHPLYSVPGLMAETPGIQIGTYVADTDSDEHLQFLQQLDVKWAMLKVADNERHNAAYYRECNERLHEYGIQIYRSGNRSVHNMPEVTLNLPGGDQKIEEVRKFISDLGDAGLCYDP